VNTDAFDPTGEICLRAHEAGAWVHVDGAFGLWAAAAPSRAYLTNGVEQADSWATDAHKWLNVPYDSELAFVRDGEALRAAMAVSAEYLPIGMAHRNPSDYTPELSRRARAHLPVCKTVCSGPQGSRLRSAKLSRAQSGTSLVRRCGRYKEDYRRAAS